MKKLATQALLVGVLAGKDFGKNHILRNAFRKTPSKANSNLQMTLRMERPLHSQQHPATPSAPSPSSATAALYRGQSLPRQQDRGRGGPLRKPTSAYNRRVHRLLPGKEPCHEVHAFVRHEFFRASSRSGPQGAVLHPNRPFVHRIIAGKLCPGSRASPAATFASFSSRIFFSCHNTPSTNRQARRRDAARSHEKRTHIYQMAIVLHTFGMKARFVVFFFGPFHLSMYVTWGTPIW